MFGVFIYNLASIAILLSSPNTVIVKGVHTIIWLDRNVYSQLIWHYWHLHLSMSYVLSECHQYNKRPLTFATFLSTDTFVAVLLISFFDLFLTTSGTGERQHSRRLSKRRRGGLARGGKRCYSFSGGYVTSHLPLSLRNARIVFVNRAAMCVCSRGGSFLSRCPSCLTPEVNPDIDTRSQGQQQSLRLCATLNRTLSLSLHNYASDWQTPHSLVEQKSTSHIWNCRCIWCGNYW